jgi:hypothetical protein
MLYTFPLPSLANIGRDIYSHCTSALHWFAAASLRAPNPTLSAWLDRANVLNRVYAHSLQRCLPLLLSSLSYEHQSTPFTAAAKVVGVPRTHALLTHAVRNQKTCHCTIWHDRWFAPDTAVLQGKGFLPSTPRYVWHHVGRKCRQFDPASLILRDV